MSKAPYFPFFPGDYLADTMGLSCCQHGVYLLLLAASWQRGPLPDDMDHLSRLTAAPPIEALRYILESYWTPSERGWINARLERERTRLENKSRKASMAALTRWGDADAMRTHSGRTCEILQAEKYAAAQHENFPPVQQKDANAYANAMPLPDPDPEKKIRGTSQPRKFSPPTVEEVTAYCIENRYHIDSAQFVDHYTANGWKVGKNPMKDWKAAVRTWTRNGSSAPPPATPSYAKSKPLGA